jgi:biotin transporter BioY
MTKDNSNRLKLGVAILCIVLVLGTLPSIYLIGNGLLDNAVVPAERSHFQIKLAAYIVEILILGALAIVLLKSRQP